MVQLVACLLVALCICSIASSSGVGGIRNGGTKLTTPDIRKLDAGLVPHGDIPLLLTASTHPALEASAPATTLIRSRSSQHLRFSVLSILLPWLYFMSTSLNIPSLPKFVNAVINNGNTDVSEASAMVYGNLAGIDALFTFLSVNLVGCLSDRFGRRPFMFISSLGLGTAYLITYFATKPQHFYMAACLDGLTSCMLSQAQAYITDHHLDGSSLSIELSKFQGLAIGMAFMIGVPLGAILSSKYNIRTPLRVAVGLCALNSILIPTLLPRAPDVLPCDDTVYPIASPTNGTCTSTGISTVITSTDDAKVCQKSINWAAANPFGAAVMLARTRRLLFGSLAYFLLNVAHCGLQVVWINYLQHKFHMSHAASGSTLMMVGVIVATLPRIVIPLIGTMNAFKYGILLHAVSLIFLGLTDVKWGVYVGMPFLAAGASALPVLLGYLTDQVSRSEVGALQGAADTVRTVAGIIGAPLVSRAFGHLISDGRNTPGGALVFAAGFSLLGYGCAAMIY